MLLQLSIFSFLFWRVTSQLSDSEFISSILSQNKLEIELKSISPEIEKNIKNLKVALFYNGKEYNLKEKIVLENLTFNEMMLEFCRIVVSKRTLKGYFASNYWVGDLQFNRFVENNSYVIIAIPLYQSKKGELLMNIYNDEPSGFVELEITSETRKIDGTDEIQKIMENKTEVLRKSNKKSKSMAKEIKSMFVESIFGEYGLTEYPYLVSAVKEYVAHSTKEFLEIYSKKELKEIEDLMNKDFYYAVASYLCYSPYSGEMLEKEKDIAQSIDEKDIKYIQKLEEKAKKILKISSSDEENKNRFDIKHYVVSMGKSPGFLVIEKDQDEVVLAFKGMDNHEELLSCLFLDYYEADGYVYHIGYKLMLDEFIRNHKKLYLSLLRKYKKVTITGHSMGGSIAVLLSIYSHNFCIDSPATLKTVVFSPMPVISVPEGSTVGDISNYLYGSDVIPHMSGGNIAKLKIILKSILQHYYTSTFPYLNSKKNNFNEIMNLAKEFVNKNYDFLHLQPVGKTYHVIKLNDDQNSSVHKFLEYSEPKNLEIFPTESSIDDHNILNFLNLFVDSDVNINSLTFSDINM